MGAWLLEGNQYSLLASGLKVTLLVLLYSFLLGVVLSLLVGVARLSEREWVRGAALAYVEFARGISSIILLFIMAIAIPILLSVGQASRMLLASIALGINMGGYGAEIVRGAIQTIPRGQSEACVALNLSPTQRLRHVVLPQSLRVILPPMGNLTIEILKGTALVSLIALPDLMQQTRFIRSQQLFAGSAADLAVLFVNVLVIYFVMAQVINAGFRFAEARVNRLYEARREPLPAHVEQSVPGAGG